AGEEDIGAEAAKAGNIEPHLRRGIGEHIEIRIVVLEPQLVGRLGAELMEPSSLSGVVKGVKLGAARETDQRLDIGVRLLVVCKAVAEVRLVGGVELVIEAARQKIFRSAEGEDAAIVFELVHQELVQRRACRIDGQNIVQNPGAGGCRESRLAG